MSEQRKATDVLLSIEQKLEQLIKLLQNKDLSDKILSNKLNVLLSQPPKENVPQFSAEAVDALPHNLIKVNAEDALPIEEAPSVNGFRRTSRPETYANKNVKKPGPLKMPVQVPKGDHVEIVVPQQAMELNKIKDQKIEFTDHKDMPAQQRSTNVVSVIQRVVDKNGKSIFLAEVEIINKSTIETVQKIKTNATGKWMCSLIPGEYSVILRKRDPISKNKLEITQDILIDGEVNPLNLPVVIVK